ncbi:MAG: hypothetical protein MI673_09010 [Thiotrichales bacterium]|nr:hypothetical protein [Thiotrichales bacterium]
MKPVTLIAALMSFANGLKFRDLFLLVAGLFVVDMIVPDMIPMIDEIILGLLAILLANLKKDKQELQEGNVIEGEVVNDDDSSPHK